MVWTEGQKSRLRPVWEAYMGRMRIYRGQAISNLRAITFGAGPATVANWAGDLASAGRRYSELVEVTGSLESHMRLEVVLWIELLCVYLKVRAASRHLPTPAPARRPALVQDTREGRVGVTARAGCRAQVVEPVQHARIVLAARPHFPDFTQVCNFILNG